MNDLTGERNVALGCLAMGMHAGRGASERRPEIVEFSGINERGDFVSLPMRTYSSGMAARLRFSIAAAKNHDVLLIDEALATGDAEFRQRSEQRIRELREEAGTVFLVSHQLGIDPGHLRADDLAGVGRDADGRPDGRRHRAVRGVHRQVADRATPAPAGVPGARGPAGPGAMVVRSGREPVRVFSAPPAGDVSVDAGANVGDTGEARMTQHPAAAPAPAPWRPARTVAVILAGGTGARLGLGIPKQLLKIAGKPIIEHTLAVFEAAPEIDEIIVLMAAGHVPDARSGSSTDAGFRKVTHGHRGRRDPQRHHPARARRDRRRTTATSSSTTRSARCSAAGSSASA